MKKGISLIVLVITIIVMIILAASVVISLSNNGLIDKANYAVDMTNQSQVQDLAALVWAECYMDDFRGNTLIEKVKEKLEKQGVKESEWDIQVTDSGVTITSKGSMRGNGLGALITHENYGDTINYTVTVNGTTYADWQIYYHDSEYVYLILKDSLGLVSLDKGVLVADLTLDELAVYEKFRVGNGTKYTLVDKVGGNTAYNSQAIAQLIKDYSNFANTSTYGSDVVGAIGGPTVELLVAAWNKKGYMPALTLTIDEFGYKINNETNIDIMNDELYSPADYWYWLSSPCAGDIEYVLNIGADCISNDYCGSEVGIRPVVCLKASIPAKIGMGIYDFELTK